MELEPVGCVRRRMSLSARSASLAALAALAGVPGCHRAKDTEQVAPPDEDPPIHLHPHPEIPPDELQVSPADAPDALPGREVPAKIEGCNDQAEPPPEPSAVPRIASGPPVTNYIPPMVIMKPIRARARCFRLCYERGLGRTPDLRGRVVVHFVVDLDGWVRKAKVKDSELTDPAVAECVAREFVGLKYPAPEGGKISVVYPLLFEPADAGM